MIPQEPIRGCRCNIANLLIGDFSKSIVDRDEGLDEGVLLGDLVGMGEDVSRDRLHEAIVEVDPTGAGDIFAAAFFFAAARGYSVHAASSFASCLASRSVTRTGLASIPTRTEVRHCFLNTPEVSI